MTAEILEWAANAAGIKKIGVLSENDFIAVLPAGGRVTEKYRNGSETIELSVQIQCRGKDQKALITALENAADAIENSDRSICEYRILNVRKGQHPMPILADEKGNYTYGREIIIKYFSPAARRKNI